jgi:hypothetical protein
MGSLMAAEVIQLVGAELEESRWEEILKQVEML